VVLEVLDHPKPETPLSNNEPIPDVAPEGWDLYEKSAPGSTAFFKEFDANGDHFLDEEEWNAAMMEAIHRHFLPATFDRPAQWSRLPKTPEGLLTLRDFVYFAGRTKAESPPPKVDLAIFSAPDYPRAAKKCSNHSIRTRASLLP
jgi:hypothetical protein